MSGEQPAQRSPFSYAEDYEPPFSEQDPTIPLITPMQRYMLEGLDKIWKGQQELKGDVSGMRTTLAAMAPRIEQLETHARWWQKGVQVAKYALPAIALQVFPALGKYVPAIVDALSKVQVPQ